MQEAQMTETTISPTMQQFLDVHSRETQTTLRVLRAYPKEKTDLRPHPRSKTARELAWMFVVEQMLSEKALTTGLDWSQAPSLPAVPASLDEIIEAFRNKQQRVADMVRDLPDEKLSGTVQFFTGPQSLGDVPMMQFLWMLLSDQIHHRGQFSIYLRMADGKVPSIYGPTADEPWR
jgi:uncharacterized damage-inducible protein DinB